MVFTGDVLGGIVEWLMVAIFGGGVLGACIGFLYRLILPKEQSKATLENKQENIKE
jgi:NhaP-type Na+/H+ or K+/H+ antiporter